MDIYTKTLKIDLSKIPRTKSIDILFFPFKTRGNENAAESRHS